VKKRRKNSPSTPLRMKKDRRQEKNKVKGEKTEYRRQDSEE